MCNLGEVLVEETWEEATEKNTIELTANMLRKNASMDCISRVTSLPIDRIAEIGKLRGRL